MELLDLKINLTGRLGRRTKYQDFDIAQLVLNVENREVQVIAPATAEAPVLEEPEETKEGKEKFQ